MDDLPENMTKARGVSKHLWHGETACPHAHGTGQKPLFELRSRPLTGRTNAELNPRSLPRGLLETEVDLRAVKPEVSQLPAIEMAQHRQRGVTLTTRDRGRHKVIDKAAGARQEHGGSAPCNWRGGGGQNVFKHRHKRILSSG